MAFSDRFLSELISRSEISDVVSDYVHLTQKGANMFGLCPFHSEKTPSFSISQDRQIYHCFGCSKGGGVINFIMEIENLSFPDAVRFLAKRAGIAVPEDDDRNERVKRDRLIELNREAARFFHDMLSDKRGKNILEYMQRRGMSTAMIKRFGIGAAPDSWDSLVRAMTEKGFHKSELAEVGLAVKSKKPGDVYDRFRNRMMFPIIDVRGDVIGFGGRVMDDSTPKYLNSPESIIFSKSRNLFGLNLAKKSKSQHIILCEGYMDVFSLHQAGFDCAVASLGTSLTADHGRLLARYTKEVLLAYDSDEAGNKAAQRAIGILGNLAVGVKVIRMPGAKDPDEYIQKRGADAFRLLLERSENHIEFRLMEIKQKYDLNKDDDRISFLRESAELLAAQNSAAVREIYWKHAANMAGVSPETAEAEVGRASKKRLAIEKKRKERAQIMPEAAIQPPKGEEQYQNVRSAAAEEEIIHFLILDGSLSAHTSDLKESDFSSPFLGRIYGIIMDRYEAEKSVSLPMLAGELTQAQMSKLTQIMQKPVRLSEGEKAISDCIEIIKTEKMKGPTDRTTFSEDEILKMSDQYLRMKGPYGGKTSGR